MKNQREFVQTWMICTVTKNVKIRKENNFLGLELFITASVQNLVCLQL